MANNMQLGSAVETTYGTPETVDRFYEFLGGESLERQQSVIQAAGLRPGLRSRLGANRRCVARQWGSGTIPMEVATTGFGRWFEHALGTVTTDNPTAGVYVHEFTPGDMGGKSMTVQKGVEPWTAAGTAVPFTFHGGKVTGWEFGINVDGFALFSVDMDFEDVDTTTALATASYSVLKNFCFKSGDLQIGDTSSSLTTLAGVSDATITGENGFNTERFFLGSSGLKNEPIENDFRMVSGAFNLEFRSLDDAYNAYASDAEKHVRLVFEGDAISGTYTELLQVDLYDVRLEGETPKIAGPEPAIQSANYTAWEQENGNSIKITYRTSDATP